MKKVITLAGIAIAFGACTPGYSGKNSATDNRVAMNKAEMQKFYDEVYNKHNAAMIDSCLSADYVEHCTEPGIPPTREGTKKSFMEFFAGYPDLNAKVDFMVADTAFVVTHYTMTGTNTGSIMGMPATGKKFNIQGVDIVRFVNGKAVEHWGYDEEMKMMQQLGMMPDMSAMMSDSSKGKKMQQ